MKNHYYVLGLERTAREEEIEHAFRALALKYHPSRNGGDRYCIDRYSRICEAYEVLIDSSRKAAYDNSLKELHFEKSATLVDADTFQHDRISQSPEERIVAITVCSSESQNAMTQMSCTCPRTVDIKKNAELTFEDKSWILLASALSVGSIGILMSRRFRAEGFARKSKQAGVMSALGVAGIILFIILVRYLRSIYVY